MPLRTAVLCLLALAAAAPAAEPPLHERVDALIEAGWKGKPAAGVADDAEFLRRASLELTGTIPSAADARAFLADKDPRKRERLIDRLLASPGYARRMADAFHVLLMERRGDDPAWAKFLHDAFATNKPLDDLARAVLNPAGAGADARAAAFFYSKRLEANEPPLVPRDVGRLFLGKDLRCAQCHDHVHVEEYKQVDFQGLSAYFQGLTKAGPAGIAEKPLTMKVPFASVFKKQPHVTGPRLPGGMELEVPTFKPGEEFLVKPDPKTQQPGVLKFSPLARLAEQVPATDAFARNTANRLWCLLMGRGLVHPLDLHHSDNPPSHPELLALLARDLAARKFDVRGFLRELALTRTYQRSGLLPENAGEVPAGSYRVALEKRLSAEQLLDALLAATGEPPPTDAKAADALRQRFVKAFAAPPGEPEDEQGPTLAGALLLLNGKDVRDWLAPKPGNLLDRLTRREKPGEVAEELYLSVLTRLPTDEERDATTAYLVKHAGDRPAALARLAWALLASAEFAVNH